MNDAIDHGESPTKPPYVIGVLDSGHQVEYEKGGKEKVGHIGVIRRPQYEKVPYTYTLVDPETGDTSEVVEVEPDDYERPTEPMPQVIDRLEDEHGWAELTDVGLVLAYGMAGTLRFWPDEIDGGEFIGIADAKVSIDARHGSAVGLYLVDDRLVPYVLPYDNTYAGDGIPGDPDVRRLSDGPVSDRLTFDVDDYGGIEDTVRHLEKEEVWYVEGYPHELNEREIVSGQNVKVAPEYEQFLRYPRYWTDSGGQKREIW